MGTHTFLAKLQGARVLACAKGRDRSDGIEPNLSDHLLGNAAEHAVNHLNLPLLASSGCDAEPVT